MKEDNMVTTYASVQNLGSQLGYAYIPDVLKSI